MDISDRLKFVRTKIALTQVELAGKLGISRSAYSVYERGELRPPAKVINQISLLYGVNLKWLETGSGEPFDQEPEPIIDTFAREFKINAMEKEILLAILDIPPETREQFLERLAKIFNTSVKSAGELSEEAIDDLLQTLKKSLKDGKA